MTRVLNRLRPALLILSAAAALAWLAGAASAQQPAVAEPASPSQKAFDDASALYQAGKWPEALAAFQNFEKTYPFSNLAAQGIYYEGWCLGNLKRLPDAINAFARLAKSFPLAGIVPAAILKEAECYRDLKDFPKAMATYQEFYQKFSKNELMPQALLSQAATLYKQYTTAKEKKETPDPKLLAQAKQIAQAVRAQFANETSARLDSLSLLGQILNEEKNYDEARKVYSELKSMRNNPRATDALFMEGESMYEAKRYEDAISYYQQVKSKTALIENIQGDIDQLRDRIPHELNNRNWLLTQIQQLRQLQAQIAAGGDLRASALFRIANCYASLGRPEQASVVYRHFLRLFPDDKLTDQAEFGLIQALTERGQAKLAEEESDKFRKKHPEGGSDLVLYAVFLQAKNLFDSGNYKEAQRLFTKFAGETKEAEMKQTAEFYTALCSAKLEQFAAAGNAFAAFAQKYPAGKLVADALFQLGRANFEISQRATDDPKAKQAGLRSAINAFEEIRAKHPKPELLPDVTFQLGYLYFYLGEFEKPSFDKAVAAFRDFLKGWPQDAKAPEAAYQTAMALTAAGKLPEAIEADKFLLEHYGDSKFACFAAFDIGKAYAMASKPAEMVKALRAYVERCPTHPQVPTALYAIAFDEEGTNQFTEAIADYHKLIQFAANGDPSPDTLNLAIKALARITGILEGQDKFSDAVGECESFLAKFIASPVAVRETITQLVSLYRNAKKLNDAYDKLKEIAAKYQQAGSVRVAVTTSEIELALTQRDYPRGYAAALRLLADPEKDQLPCLSSLAIGNAMLKTDHFDQARDAFDKIMTACGTDAKLAPGALVGLGQAYLGLNKFDDAELAFKKMLATAPDNPLALDARSGLAKVDLAKGYQLEAAGKTADAKPLLKEGVDLFNVVMGASKGQMAGEAALALGNFFLKHEKDCKTALPYFLRVLFLSGGPSAEEATYRVAECNEGLSGTLPNPAERDASRESARTGYRNYLTRYPDGKFAPDAKKRLDALPAPAPPR